MKWEALWLSDNQAEHILRYISSIQRMHYLAICKSGRHLSKLQRGPVVEILGYSWMLRAKNGNVDLGRLHEERVRLVKFSLNEERTIKVHTSGLVTDESKRSNTPSVAGEHYHQSTSAQRKTSVILRNANASLHLSKQRRRQDVKGLREVRVVVALNTLTGANDVL